MYKAFKKILFISGGAAAVVFVIFIYNVGLWVTTGSPTTPRLENTWWGGYYDSDYFGRQWCIARFVEESDNSLVLVIWGGFGEPDIFDVQRRSSNPEFVQYKFSHHLVNETIEAKQLYSGKRYFVGRLIAFRFSDFWKLNNDITIRGRFTGVRRGHNFAIEPIDEYQARKFWRSKVRPYDITPFPEIN